MHPTNPVTAEQFDSTEKIVEQLSHQTVIDPNPNPSEYQCNSGNKGFRIYLTSLPQIEYEDIKPGLLIYDPFHDPYTVHEITSEPYKEGRSKKVDVINHSRSHTGDNPDIKQTEWKLFVSHIRDTMTYLKPKTTQKKLTKIADQTI